MQKARPIKKWTDKKDPIDENSQNSSEKEYKKISLSTCEQLKNKEVLVSNF